MFVCLLFFLFIHSFVCLFVRSFQEKLLLKDAENAKMLSQKNSEIIDLTAKYEKELADKDVGWKIRIDVAVNTCKDKLQLSYAEGMERLKRMHAEELSKSEAERHRFDKKIKALQRAAGEKDKELEDKNAALEKLTMECRQHLEVLEACKKPHRDQVSQLKGVVSVQEKTIEDLEKARQIDSAALEEAREEVRSLSDEQRKKALQWQQEKSEYLSKMRGFQTDSARLQSEISRLKSDIARLQLDQSSGIEDSTRQLRAERQQAVKSSRKMEDDFKEQKQKLLQAIQLQKEAASEAQAKVREFVEREKELKQLHESEVEAARREEQAKGEERLAEAKKKLREDLEASYSRREQSSKSLAETQKEHALSMLRRELEMEADKERHSRVVLERKLGTLKEQHKREVDLLEAQTTADRERTEKRHTAEMAQKMEEAKQQLEQVRKEHKDTERTLK